MPTDEPKRRPEKDDEEVELPETGADVDNQVEPDDEYELDLGVDVDALDGALEDVEQTADVPSTGAYEDWGVEPEDDHDLDIPGVDASDGALEEE